MEKREGTEGEVLSREEMKNTKGGAGLRAEEKVLESGMAASASAPMDASMQAEAVAVRPSGAGAGASAAPTPPVMPPKP